MAQQALGAGTVLPRERALFGLLDADGWAWASVKAFAWLVIIILHARLPAGPRLLPDGRADGRPRRPRLVADQPLPADQRVAAVPGAGRGAHPVGAVARRAGPPAATDRRLGHPGRDPDPVHRWQRRHDRPVDTSTSPRPSGRATSTSGPRARLSPSRAPTRASRTWPAASTSSVAGMPPAPRPTRSSCSARTPDRRARRVDDGR